MTRARELAELAAAYDSGGLSNMKNRIINGDMRIDQRNAGASVTPANGNYTIDRWQASLTQASRYSVQQNAGAVTPPAGFANYLGVTSLSAYSVVSSDIFSVGQAIEGFNFDDLGFGTANAQTVTLSFWVRSSLTGTFGAALVNDNTATRSYPFTYTISAVNTWEQKTVTIPGDTSGTWGRTNGIGARIRFGLGTGSTFTTTAGAWTAGNFWSVTGAVSVVGTNGATFYITGVQLEKGSTATSFDYRPYGTELQLCQRYFEKSYNIATVPGTNTSNGHVVGSVGAQTYGRAGTAFKVTKRAAPTMAFWSDGGVSGEANYWNGGTTGTLAVGNTVAGESYFETEIQGGTWGTRAYFYYHWTASIEL